MDKARHKSAQQALERARGNTVARWLARKAMKAEWLAQGFKLQTIEVRELNRAAEDYLNQNREAFLAEARAYLERFAQRAKR